MVVDGYVTDQPGPYTITLSKTAAYFNNAPTPRVTGAVVTLSDNEGHTETLTEVEPGKYVTSTLEVVWKFYVATFGKRKEMKAKCSIASEDSTVFS